MSVKYIPVQWNKNKWYYDGIMLAGVVIFLSIFLFASPGLLGYCLLYTSPSPRDQRGSRMPSSA